MVKQVLSLGDLGKKPLLYLWSPGNLDLSFTITMRASWTTHLL